MYQKVYGWACWCIRTPCWELPGAEEHVSIKLQLHRDMLKVIPLVVTGRGCVPDVHLGPADTNLCRLRKAHTLSCTGQRKVKVLGSIYFYLNT